MPSCVIDSMSYLSLNFSSMLEGLAMGHIVVVWSCIIGELYSRTGVLVGGGKIFD